MRDLGLGFFSWLKTDLSTTEKNISLFMSSIFVYMAIHKVVVVFD